MSALAGGLANVAGQGFGLSQSVGLVGELTGQPGRVQILQPGYGTVLQFDACINEQHGRDAQVTTNPIEDGSVISDHVVVQPLGLSLTGIVSDTPLYDSQRFLRQTLGNLASTLMPPLGVLTAASAITAFQLSHPQSQLESPSHQAYVTLMRLAAGDPTASPPTLPQPFTVLTSYARYPDMLIKSLQLPRDAGTSGSCVFTLQMEQIQRVTPQVVNVAYIDDKALGAGRKVVGEKDAALSKIVDQTKLGRALGRDVATSVGDTLGQPVNAVANTLGLGG